MTRFITTLALVGLALNITACNAPCEIAGVPSSQEQCEAYIASQQAGEGAATTATGDVIVSTNIDVSEPFVDLGQLGFEFEYQLGIWVSLFEWDVLYMQTGPVGYDALGGSEDWDPSHVVNFITKVVSVDTNGDGKVDGKYAAQRFTEDPDATFIGNEINVANGDCRDPANQYQGMAGCFPQFDDYCGYAFTAHDQEEANRGECGLSVIARNGALESGPSVSTF